MVAGIDLGTTFSAIAALNEEGKAEIIVNRDGERTTPSVVMFEEGTIVVGEQAKENSIIEPYNVCQFVKRQMGKKRFSFDLSRDERYSAEEISAMILKRLKEDAEDARGEAVEGAVITVPAYFEDSQRKATQDAGEIAGLNVLGIINEPTAAAIAYCQGQADTEGNVMVFDLGGGTFDITILRLTDHLSKVEILSTIGDRNMGGFDFDNVIISKVMKAFQDKYGIDLEEDDVAAQDLRLKAEGAKKALSSRQKANISVVSGGKPLKVEITRDEFVSMIRRYINNMKTTMEVALDEAALSWSDIKKILLVGGSTKIPAIQEMIEQVSGIVPSKELNPDEAVAIGAAYYAENLYSKRTGEKNRAKKEVEVRDVNSHSLGVLALDPDTGDLRASFIIPKNTELPAANLRFYTTTADNQKQIDLEVVEGDDPDPEYDTVIGKAEVKLPPLPAGSVIVVVMQYDINGIVHAVLCTFDEEQDKIGDFLGEITIVRESNLTKEQVNRKRRALDTREID